MNKKEEQSHEIGKNCYDSRKAFNRVFKEFIWRDEFMHLLVDVGWCDGGCRSLMKAMQIWLSDDQVKPYQIVKRKEQLHSEHALIKVGRYYLDGYGVSTHNALYKRWKGSEGLPSVFIRPFTPETEPPNGGEEPFYIPDKSIQAIVQKLDEYLDRDKLLTLLASKE